MSSPKPFELIRWESGAPPSLEFWMGWIAREKMLSQEETLESGVHTPEVKFPSPIVRILVSGQLQCSFPGYGVVELQPGDCVEILPETLHDLKVISRDSAILVTGFR